VQPVAAPGAEDADTGTAGGAKRLERVIADRVVVAGARVRGGQDGVEDARLSAI